MKKHSLITLTTVLLAATLCSVSCYKDLTTYATKEIPRVIRTNTNAITPVVFAFGRINTFEPEFAHVKDRDTIPFNPSDYEAYDYDWHMTTSTSIFHFSMEWVGDGWPLELAVDREPSGGTDYYTMTMSMTHKETGMRHSFTWRVQIGRPDAITAGLLVAHTRDGVTSDICMIKSHHYCGDMWPVAAEPPLPDTVFRNMFSQLNDGPIQGVVSQIMWSKRSDRPIGEIAVIVRDQEYISLDVPTMKVRARNQQMFVFAPRNLRPQFAFTNGMGGSRRHAFTALVNDNQLWSYHAEFASDVLGRYLPLIDDPNIGDYELEPNVVVANTFNSTHSALLFDRKNGRIVRLHAPPNPAGDGVRYGIRPMQAPEEGSVFDHRNLQGFDALFAAHFHNINPANTAFPFHRSLWLLRERATNKRFIYVLQHGEEPPATFRVRGRAIYDASNLTGINNATAYAALFNHGEFFYAVGNILYVAILQDGTNVISRNDEVLRLANRNEVITHIVRHVDDENRGRVPVMDVNTGEYVGQDARHYVLTIATYDGRGNGKVYALTRTHPGAGRISTVRGEWGGFGRITALEQRHR